MQIDVFTLCDNAQNYAGKMVIVGVFNQISTQQFPFVYSFSLAGRIGYDNGGTKEYELEFVDPNGNAFISPIKWSIDLQSDNDMFSSDFVMAFNQVYFMIPGIYRIILKTEGEERALKLYVAQIPQ